MSLIASHRRLLSIAAVVIATLACLGIRAVSARDPYTLTMLMPAADGTFVGAKVVEGGQQVGHVSDLGVRDGQAAVTITLDDAFAPVPAGTNARIKWESVLGARIVELTPGKASNPPLASGHLVTGNLEGVEIDDLLATLDAPTRAQVKKLVGNLDSTLAGHETDLNRTLLEAGPTFKTLGAVAAAVGQDGPAIRQIVQQLHGVAATVAGRDQRLAASVRRLNTLTAAVAGQQQALSQTLARLPGTIDAATTTLNGVEQPVTDTRAVLRTLRPTADRLPAVAADLRPVLADAAPALARLPRTLSSADSLLKRTPDLVAGANDLLPDLNSSLLQVNPMVAFLRPYTPELVGWLSNWTSLFASQNASGNYARALITASASSLDDVQSRVPVGQKQDARPAPGSLAGQPWTDANGDAIQ
ncbi:MlaD family protein [Nocardioides sp. TRM66260-LWL]|uniref:MlaD family protein n=1 Tax=Nocardioides sp. TRM66260-LWL TaxID=2874478 RepID=UPI001CC7C7D2|nr:MlaD family protein [Nocardioides sp. TRM66260-LWL]MBZ5735312.1 MlaD family protein [Nocardioides sp. TRM66260-LWL]